MRGSQQNAQSNNTVRPKTPTRQGGAGDATRQRQSTQGGRGGNNRGPQPYSIYAAREAKEVVLNIMGAPFYGDKPAELSKITTQRFPRLIKEAQEECRVDPSVMVRDLSLVVKAGQEDEAFAKNPELWLNFRRGNTLLELYDPLDYNRLTDIVVARKGLNKFFDINHDFISREARYRDDYLNQYNSLVKNLTMAPIKRAMLEGHKVEAIKMLKANGENCQVSYQPNIDAWIIASKNVGLVARNMDDVELYTKKNAMRYSYAVLMARCWFTIVEQFNKKDYESLKQDFAHRTFVGEYIGNQACQHLVKYPRETIVFYAVVENYSKRMCMVPEDSIVLFKKYKLDIVNIDSMGLYNDYDHLCDDLQREFETVSGLSIRDEEEGAVVYFVLRHSEDANKDQVLSLGKFKTLEYRLFRKMREKLRNFCDGSTNTSSDIQVQRFISQSKELCRDPNGNLYKLPHPLDFYIDICVLAFRLISRGPQKEVRYFSDLLMNEYVHFLEEVLHVYEEENRGKSKNYVGRVSFDSRVLDNQAAIQYSGPPGEKRQHRAAQKAQGPQTPGPTVQEKPVQIVKEEKKREVVQQKQQPKREVQQVVAQQMVESDEMIEENVRVVSVSEKSEVSLRSTKFIEEEQPIVRQVEKPKPQGFQLGNNLVIIAPVFTLSHQVMDELHVELGNSVNLIVTDTYHQDNFQQDLTSEQAMKSGVPTQVNLILQYSLNGIAPPTKLISHTDKVYYFVVNYTVEHLNSLREQDLETLKEQMYAGSAHFDSQEALEHYIDEEIRHLEEGVALQAIKKQSNVEFIHSEDLSKDLLNKVNWAKYRLQPVVIIPPKPKVEPIITQRQPEDPRKVVQQNQLPPPVLKKPNEPTTPARIINDQRGTAANRAESGSKKRVKINEVPQYEPSQNQLSNLRSSNSMTMMNRGGSTRTKSIIVIMPVGIPGMGKSTMIETQIKPFFEDTDVNFVTFASDRIRKELVDEEIEKNKRAGIKKTRDQVFADTGRKSVQMFFQILEEHIYQAIESQTHLNTVIVLDKNHPPQALGSTIENINKFVNGYRGNKTFNLYKIALVPQMSGPNTLYQDYPFSLSFLFQCFLRCLDRNDHETLTNSDPNILARVQVSFFKSYKGLRFDGEDGRYFAQSQGLDDLIKLPLTLEHPDLDVPYNVQVCIDKCLKLTTGMGPAQPHEEFDKLVHLGNLYKSFFNGLTKLPMDYSQNYRKVQGQNGGNQTLGDLQNLLKRCFETPMQRGVQQQLVQEAAAQANVYEKVFEQRKVVVQQKQQPNVKRQVAQQVITVREVVSKPVPEQYVAKSSEGARAVSQNQAQLVLEEQKQIQPKVELKTQQQEEKVINQAGPLDFETQVSRRQHAKKHDSEESESDQSDERVPLYLGITLHNDRGLNSKMAKIFETSLNELLEDFSSSVLIANVDAIKEIWFNRKESSNGWRKPQDYHVTCLYLGKDEEKKEHKIYQGFENNIEVPVTILAFVIVPNKIVAGICFPEHDVENRCPHVTLLINEWQPVMSNNLLEAACTRGASSPFAAAYDELRQNGRVSEDKQILNGQVKVSKDNVSSSCYFVALQEPITFHGVTKTYF